MSLTEHHPKIGRDASEMGSTLNTINHLFEEYWLASKAGLPLRILRRTGNEMISPWRATNVLLIVVTLGVSSLSCWIWLVHLVESCLKAGYRAAAEHGQPIPWSTDLEMETCQKHSKMENGTVLAPWRTGSSRI